LSVIDILLVTLIFFGLIYLLRDTQAMLLLRGFLSLLVSFALLTVLVDLPAFSWLLTPPCPPFCWPFRLSLRLKFGAPLSGLAGPEHSLRVAAPNWMSARLPSRRLSVLARGYRPASMAH
jgi:hypothetical protein